MAETARVRGAFDEAVEHGRRATLLAAAASDIDAQVDALLCLGSAYHAAGRPHLALTTLRAALSLAMSRKPNDDLRLASVLNSLGAAEIFTKAAGEAEHNLQRALTIAAAAQDRGLQSGVLNNLGNFFASRNDLIQADLYYQRSIDVGSGRRESSRECETLANLADAECRQSKFADAKIANLHAAKAAAKLAPSHAKSFCLLHCGRTCENIFASQPASDQELRLSALSLYDSAAQSAKACGDDVALAYALGYAGHLYEQEQNFPIALTLTEQALSLAQGTRSPDLLYRWHWQCGRIHRQQGHAREALADYQHARQTLKDIREEISARVNTPNGGSSFRDAVGGAFQELVDLLLRRAEHEKGDAQTQTLKDAMNVCDELKALEVEDYFRDDCSTLLKRETVSLADFAPNGGPPHQALTKTVIIYIVPLVDRTAIITNIDGQIQHTLSRVTASELETKARELRTLLQNYRSHEPRAHDSDEYLHWSKGLYQCLISPIKASLPKGATLVFVTDGALQAIPLAALFDGERFLIEDFPVAVSPGLQLMEPSRSDEEPSIMVGAITQPVTGKDGTTYDALPGVTHEISAIRRIYQDSPYRPKVLQDFQFTEKALADELQRTDYSILHLASHGRFESDSAKSYVLAFDAQLGLDQIEAIVKPTQLRRKPLSLLCLSACETALGKNGAGQAALGLAGVGIKAGARSTLGTLWCVDDQKSSLLIERFYENLHRRVGTKAKCLQEAQRSLLRSPGPEPEGDGASPFVHPYFWSPYILIGNWL